MSRPGRPARAHSQAVRVLRMVRDLTAPRSLEWLAQHHGITVRTVRRDLCAIAQVHPLRREGNRYAMASAEAAS